MRGTTLPDVPAFEAIEIFRGVGDHALRRIAELARVRRLPKRARVFSQGDEGARAHAVLEGAVSIAQSGSNGAQMVLRIAGPGQMLETVAIFNDGRYLVDAETVSETVEASWNETDFRTLIGAFPPIAFNLLRTMAARLQEMEERVHELATRNAERRIAFTVLRLAKANGRATPAGISIDIPLRRKDVADIAGTTLHTASRVLAGWERTGLVAKSKRMLTVKSLPELRAKIED